jgi:hypothetical protein
MTLDAMNDLDVPKEDKEKIYYLNAKKLFWLHRRVAGFTLTPR